MERLKNSQKGSDSWAVARSLAALTYIYDYEGNSKKVVQSFKNLEKLTDSNDSLLFSGPLAANAMVKLGKLNEAENSRSVYLELLDGSGQFDRQGDMHRLIAMDLFAGGSSQRCNPSCH